MLDGLSPYTVPEFYYPVTMAYLFALFALVPLPLALTLWWLINVGLLLRRPKWFLYFPVMHALSAGQIDLFWWALAGTLDDSVRSALLAAFLTLKPQDAVILLPFRLIQWYRHDRRLLVIFAVCVTVLWLPGWKFPGLSPRYTPSLFSLPLPSVLLLPLAVALLVWGLRQREHVLRAALMLISPGGMFYTTLLLMSRDAWLIPLSWLAMALSLLLGSVTPFVLLPAFVVVRKLIVAERTNFPYAEF